MKKKFTTILLVMLLVSSYAVPALGSTVEVTDEIIISPMYTYISTAKTQLNIDSNGKADVTTYLTGNTNVTSTKATIRLQRYINGSWTTIKTWNESSNSRVLIFNDTYNVASGYDYRVQSVVTAYSGTQSESNTLTSSSQRY